MHILRDSKAIEAFLAITSDQDLSNLIAGRIEELSEFIDEDISELAHLIVIDGAADSVTHLQEAIGFSPLVNRFDGHPYGSPEFTPSWDSLTDHAGWYELTYVMSGHGFGLVLFISKTAGVDPQLLAMCARYAEEISP